MARTIEHRPFSSAVHEPSPDQTEALVNVMLGPLQRNMRPFVGAFAAAHETGQTPPAVISFCWLGDPRGPGGFVSPFSRAEVDATPLCLLARQRALAQGRGLPAAVLVITSHHFEPDAASGGWRLICGAVIETASGAFGRTHFTVHLVSPAVDGVITARPAEWVAPDDALPEGAIGFYGIDEQSDPSSLNLSGVRVIDATPAQRARLRQAFAPRRH